MIKKDNNISHVSTLDKNFQLGTIEDTHPLKNVCEEINQVVDIVDNYKKEIEEAKPPVVNGEPWYKFPFGKASVEEVNKALKNFSDFVQHTFKLVAFCQNLQNENDVNICRLIGLLAIAEANAYEELESLASMMNDFSVEDAESVEKLKKLEEQFIQSLSDSSIENDKKEEQMSRLVDYVTLFAESKTKKIRSISISLSNLRSRLSILEEDLKNKVTISILEAELSKKPNLSALDEKADKIDLIKKQDYISDLDKIRSNAQKGATALQPTDVSAWAKEETKPSYTAEEVHALSDSTFIPSKMSDLENDKGFLTEHQNISGKADISFVKEQLQRTQDNLNQEVTTLQQTLQKTQEDLQKEHQGYEKLKRALVTTSIGIGTISVGALIALLILIL